MTIFIHIGMQKTGSSALETTLAANRSVLAEAGIDYPATSIAPGPILLAHHDLVWALQKEPRVADPARQIRQMRDILAASESRKVVLSSEGFCDLEAEQIDALASILPSGRDVRIVCYFRNQIDWIESFLNHKIKSTAYKSARKIVPLWIGKADFFSMIERWAGVFGEPAITGRIYTPGIDTIQDFLGVIGEAGLAVERPPHPVNVSLSAPLLRMKVVANAGGANANIRRLLTDIQLATRMGPRTQQLTVEERQTIVDIAEPSNRRLWDKYLRGQGEPFVFAPQLPDAAATAISPKSLLEILAHAVAFQQRQIDALADEVRRLKGEKAPPDDDAQEDDTS